jgi:hypothetical protein
MGCAGQGKSIAVDVHLEDVAWFMQQATQKGVDITCGHLYYPQVEFCGT